jgi:hypothetical protein
VKRGVNTRTAIQAQSPPRYTSTSVKPAKRVLATPGDDPNDPNGDFEMSPKQQCRTPKDFVPTGVNTAVAKQNAGVPKHVVNLHNGAVAKAKAKDQARLISSKTATGNAIPRAIPSKTNKGNAPDQTVPSPDRPGVGQLLLPVSSTLSAPPVAAAAAAAAARNDSGAGEEPTSPDENENVEGDAAAAGNDSGAGEVPTSPDENENVEGDAALYDTNNASATAAACQDAATAHSDDVHIDLGQGDASTMPTWWEMFLNSKCGGGFLARSLFSAAAQDSVLGAHKWIGPKSVTGTKSVLAEMRSKWIEWNEIPTVNEWVRAKLFHIIVTNPKTYAKVKVKEVLEKSAFLEKVEFLKKTRLM